MSNTTNGINEILSELYDMIQEAKGAMLQPDKCVINRDDALNIIEEAIAQLPSEIKSAKTIVEARNELIAQGRKEAENAVATAKAESDKMLAKAQKEADNILAKANEKAQKMVSEEAVYSEAKRQSKEMIDQAQAKIEELKKVSNAFVDDAMHQAETAMESALSSLKTTRTKFNAMTKSEKQQNQNGIQQKKAQPFFQDISID